MHGSGPNYDIKEYKGTETKVKVPAGYHGRKIVKINKNAFKGNTTMTSAEIPKSITESGDSAFEGCSSLTKVTLYNTVKKISKAAFKNCVKLTTMNSKD